MYRFFETLRDPFDPSYTQKPPATLVAYLWNEARSLGWLLPIIAFTSLCVALGESLLIYYIGRLIDLMTESGPAAFWAQHKIEMILAILALMVARPAIIGINNFLLNQTLACTLNLQAMWRAHKHMLGQSVSYFQSDFAGRLSNRVMQMGNATEDSIYTFFEAIWFASIYLIGASILISQIDPRLTLVLAVWIVLYVLYAKNVVSRTTKASEKLSDVRSLTTGRVVDSYANIEAVKLFAGTKAEERYALSAFKRYWLRFVGYSRIMTEMQIVLNILNGYLMAGMGAVGVYLWIGGDVTIGAVSAAAALALRLNGMSGWIMWVANQLFQHFGVIREGLRSISVPHQVVDAPDAAALVPKKGRVAFKDISHHYGKGKGGIDHVSLEIKPGEKVGLVGPSGAGKSTLISLMLRFRDTENGVIEIDGQNIAELTQESLRQTIGVVSQDNSLMHRSVRANLLYGRPEATEAQMIAAAKQAEAHEFIVSLKDPQGRTGYDAYVGERGVQLSGGQRQRIAIARMILKDAPIVILDEATSALDSQVENAIQNSLAQAIEGKTVIAIAHRLSTIAAMDRIVVLKEGRIEEDGSHDELLTKGGLYADLWAMQSGGFLQS